jgi:hypothetical protein
VVVSINVKSSPQTEKRLPYLHCYTERVRSLTDQQLYSLERKSTNETRPREASLNISGIPVCSTGKLYCKTTPSTAVDAISETAEKTVRSRDGQT